jgi:hypothetical protein
MEPVRSKEALGGHTPVPPWQAFAPIEVGAHPRVRPGRPRPWNNLTRTHHWLRIRRRPLAVDLRGCLL